MAATCWGTALTTTQAVRAAGRSSEVAMSQPWRRAWDTAMPRLATSFGNPVGYAASGMTTPVLGGLAAIPAVRRLIELALDEDLGRGDVTSRAVFGDAPGVA